MKATHIKNEDQELNQVWWANFFDFLKKPWFVDGSKRIPIVTKTLEFQIELLNQLKNISLDNIYT